jgi:hypothetical protein
MTQQQVADHFGCGKSQVAMYCPQVNKKMGLPKVADIKLGEYGPKVSRITPNTLTELAERTNLTRRRMELIEPGGKITLERGTGRELKRISGTVEVKYPDKLLLRNERDRLEMVTFADMLTMRVGMG